jgi:hypothetical protein
MNKLVVTFKDEAGKEQNWTVRHAAQDLTAEGVQGAMDRFVALDLFEKDGVRQYQEIVSAKYVEVIETPLF